ncbi:MAG: protein kinase, partial [Acetobacteraceae bacterium]|nr:protein kinase [Acetobacteraceae bacterium]
MTDGESDNLIGQVIAERYEVVSSIDAVGNARVYKVKDRQDGVLRALKLISKIQIENVELFQAEADKVKNQIKHPGLVQLCDAGVVRPLEGEPYAYLVSDLISGRSLYNVLNRQGRIELNEALSIITQICQVVKHLHATD